MAMPWSLERLHSVRATCCTAAHSTVRSDASSFSSGGTAPSAASGPRKRASTDRHATARDA